MKKQPFSAGALALLLSLSLCGCGPAPSPGTAATVPAAGETTVPAGDSLLDTLEAPLPDGTVLTLSVLGKTDEAMGCQGVREIQVRKGEDLCQTILISQAIEADGVDGIDAGYSQAFLENPAASVKDVRPNS